MLGERCGGNEVRLERRKNAAAREGNVSARILWQQQPIIGRAERRGVQSGTREKNMGGICMSARRERANARRVQQTGTEKKKLDIKNISQGGETPDAIRKLVQPAATSIRPRPLLRPRFVVMIARARTVHPSRHGTHAPRRRRRPKRRDPSSPSSSTLPPKIFPTGP